MSYTTQQQQTISQSDCDLWRKVDFIQQPGMNSSVAGPKKHAKTLSKPNLHPRKRSRSLFGGLLPVRSTTVFWIPVKPLHQRSMLSKSMRCTKNWNAWSQHGSIESASSSQWQHRPHISQPMLQSWAKLGFKSYLIHIFTDLSPTDYHIFKHQENASTTRRKQKMLSKRLWNLEEWIFTL